MYSRIYAIVILFVVLLSACKEEPNDPIEPIDPCKNAKPVTANFDIFEESYWSKGFLIYTDTIIAGNIAHFKASEKYDSYTWQVGTDTSKYHTMEFTLKFDKPYKNVPVKLIVRKKPNLDCYPDDDGIDTLIKYINVVSVVDIPIYGDYYGCEQDNPQDSYTINIGRKYAIDYHDSMPYINNLSYCIDTIPYGNHGEWWPNVEVILYYRGIVFNSYDWAGNGCLVPKGRAELQKDMKTIIIDYSTIKDIYSPKIRISRKFIGKKIYDK